MGRSSSSAIVVDNADVSRAHLEILHEGGHWVVRDLGSVNGTLVNGRRVDAFSVPEPLEIIVGGERGTPMMLTPSSTSNSTSEPPETATFTGLAAAQLMAEHRRTREHIAPVSSPTSSPTAAVPAAGGRPVVRIGRGGDNDVALTDLLASRRHAEVHFDSAGHATVVDLRSRNGTYVDGQRIVRAAAGPGSVITIGNTSLTIDNGTVRELTDRTEVGFVVDGLTVTARDGSAIIHDVSFEVPPRSLIGVLGPSGAGKSTVIKAIVGAIDASGGQVLYGGVDLLAAFGTVRRSIGYVPQDEVLHQGLTVRRALEYAARLRLSADVTDDEAAMRIDEVLGQLGLTVHDHKRIDQLSGGQRKRVATAMELLTRPPLLVLDEPTSGLDPGNEKTLMELLRTLATGHRSAQATGEDDEGRRVIVVTHSVQSLALCDRVLVMAPGTAAAPGGQVAYYGPPEQLTAFFGVDDPAEVFRRIEHGDVDWPAHHRTVSGHHSRPATVAATADPSRRASRERPLLNPAQQFQLLVRRYVDVIASDRANVMLLALQAPVIGLMLALLADDAFDPPGGGASTTLLILLLGLVLSITYLGASNSVREIVKERAIFLRERALGQSPIAYVGSKAVVLSAITATQAVVLVVVGTIRAGRIDAGPLFGPLLGVGRFELMVFVALIGIAAVGLGLMVSALVDNADKATTLLPVLLLAMYLLSGGPTDLGDSPLLRELSYLNSARWGLAAAAKSVDAEGLLFCTGFAPPGSPCRAMFERSVAWGVGNIVMLLAIAAASAAAAVALVQRRPG